MLTVKQKTSINRCFLFKNIISIVRDQVLNNSIIIKKKEFIISLFKVIFYCLFFKTIFIKYNQLIYNNFFIILYLLSYDILGLSKKKINFNKIIIS